MKTKIFILVTFIIALSLNAFGQIAITSKKVKYTRDFEGISEYKKTFEVNYPEVSGISNAAVAKRLENSISYWNNFETTLKASGEDSWLSSMDYEVNYNKNSMLDITLIMDGSGAYPSSSMRNLVIDTKTGKRVYIADTFINIGKLLVKIEKAQKLAIAESAKEDEISVDEIKDEMRRNSSYKLEEFSVSDTGVTFIFDYGFPHVIKALEPDGRYFFTWTELRTHIKPDGLLGRFIR